MDEWKKALGALERFKYPLLILAAGVLLMLLPSAEKKDDAAPRDPGQALAALLSSVQGVGQARVLISESGVVVACTGASNAAVRLDILHAVSSYTGFGSDKITILKLRI